MNKHYEITVAGKKMIAKTESAKDILVAGFTAEGYVCRVVPRPDLDAAAARGAVEGSKLWKV